VNGSRRLRAFFDRGGLFSIGFLLALAAQAEADSIDAAEGRPAAVSLATAGRMGDEEDPAAAPPKKAAPGKSANQTKKGRDLRVSGLFALRFEYDDNIIHYSDVDLVVFSTQPSYGKYSITQAGDWIIRPRLDLTARSKALTGRDLEAQLRLTSWRYVENTLKSNESYQLRLKHPGFGKDNFQVTFYHAPTSYIRNFRDRPPFTSKVVPLAYTDFSYTSTSVTLGYWRRLASVLEGKLDVKRSWRFFNQAFMENDTWEWRTSGSLTWRAIGPLKIAGSYDYTDAKGRGADSVDEIIDTSDNSDPSFARDTYGLDFSLSSRKGFLRVNDLTLGGEYQAFYFTSRKRPDQDPLHVGRRDEVRRAELTFRTVPVVGAASLEGGYRYSKRSSTAVEVSVGMDIGEEKDYTDNRMWFGIEIPF
jgi:hypothetical protein